MNNKLITPERCEFVGALIGDGNLWTDRHRFRIELTGDPILDKDYFIYLSKLACTIFNKAPYKFRIRYGGLRFRLQSKSAFELLTSMGFKSGKKAKTIKIPKIIINKGWRSVKYVIRGIFDTDGTVFFSKKTYKERIYPTIEISTMSKNLATQIGQELVSNGFRARIRGNDKRGYHIGLYGCKMLNLWLNKIGCSNPRHRNKINKYIETHDKILINCRNSSVG